jgi:hypothetical protein
LLGTGASFLTNRLGGVATSLFGRQHKVASVFGLCFLQVDNHEVQVVIKPGRELAFCARAKFLPENRSSQ